MAHKSRKKSGARPPGGARNRPVARLNRPFLVGLLVVVAVGSAAGVGIWFWQRSRLRDSALAASEAMLNEGRRDAAVQNLYRYLDQNPGQVDVLRRLAGIMADSPRSAAEIIEAARLYEQLLKVVPSGDAEALEIRRQIARLDLDYTEILRDDTRMNLLPVDMVSAESRTGAAGNLLKELRGLERQEPSGTTFRLLARYEEMRLAKEARDPGDEKIKQVVDYYQKALALEPGDFDASRRLAAFYLDRLGQADKALDVADQAVAAAPDKSRGRLLRYRILRRANRDAEARAELEAIAQGSPGDIDVHVVLIEDALRRRDSDAARIQFDSLPDAIREGPLGRRLEAFIESSDGHPDQAMTLLKDGLMASGGTDLRSAIELLDLFQQVGRIAEARPLLDQIRRIVPDTKHPLIVFFEARQQALSGRAADALPILEAIRRNDWDRIEPRFQERLMIAIGQAQYAAGSTEKAIATYKEALQANPGSVGVREGLARALLGSSPQDAIGVLQEGLGTAPDSVGLKLILAEAQLRRQGQRPEAKRNWDEFDATLKELEAVAPNNAQIVRLRADRLAQEGDVPGTTKQLEALTRQSPRNLEPWLRRAEYLSRTGRPDEALRVVEAAAGPDAVGDRIELRVARARLLTLLKRGREAREAITRDIDRLTPAQQSEGWRLLGDLAASRGETKEARAAYEQWSRLDPENFRPLFVLMDEALQAGDLPEVDRVLDRLEGLLKGGPEGSNAKTGGRNHYLYKLATALKLVRVPVPGAKEVQIKRRLAEAEQKVDEVIAEAPYLENAHLLKGDLLQHHGEKARAIGAYRQALALGAPAALPRLIELFVERKEFAEIEALPPQAGRFETNRLAAEACLRHKQRDQAVRFVDRTVTAHPNAPEVQAWSAAVLAGLGSSDDAEREAAKLVEARPAELEGWLNLIRLRAARGSTEALETTIQQARAKVANEKPELVEAACRRVGGDIAGADRLLKEALRVYPDDNAVAVLASSFFQETNQLALAVGCMRGILKREPGNRSAARGLAVILASKAATPAEWDEAWSTLGPEDEAQGRAIEERMARGAVLARSPDPARRDDGIQRLEELLVDLPPDISTAAAARDELVQALIRAGRSSRACELAAFSARRNPTPQTFLLNAEALIEAGRKDEARAPLDRVALALPADPREAGLRLRVLWDPENPDSSADEIEKTYRARAEASAGDAEVFGRLAILALESAGPKLLPNIGRIARRMAQNNAALSWMVARVLQQEGKPAEALDQCAASIRYGTVADAQEAARTSVLIAFGDEAKPIRDRAGEILKAALDRFRGDAELKSTFAMHQHLVGNYRDEVALYQALLADQPDSLVLLNNLAWAQCEGLKTYDEALRNANRGLDRFLDDPRLLDTRGVIFTRKGDYDQAIRDLERSIEITAQQDPNHARPPVRCFHLARAYAAKGDQAQARRWLDEALNLKLTAAQLESFERPEFEELQKRP